MSQTLGFQPQGFQLLPPQNWKAGICKPASAKKNWAVTSSIGERFTASIRWIPWSTWTPSTTCVTLLITQYTDVTHLCVFQRQNPSSADHFPGCSYRCGLYIDKQKLNVWFLCEWRESRQWGMVLLLNINNVCLSRMFRRAWERSHGQRPDQKACLGNLPASPRQHKQPSSRPLWWPGVTSFQIPQRRVDKLWTGCQVSDSRKAWMVKAGRRSESWAWFSSLNPRHHL